MTTILNIDQDSLKVFATKFNSLLGEVGALPSLVTTDKTTIVNAINELKNFNEFNVLKSNPAGANNALTQTLLTNYIFSGALTRITGPFELTGTVKIGTSGSTINLDNNYLSLGNNTVTPGAFGNGGIELKRGLGKVSSSLFWNESTSQWELNTPTLSNKKLFHDGNVFSTAKQFLDSGILTSDKLSISASLPYIDIIKSTASLDGKTWRIKTTSTASISDLIISSISDNGTVETEALRIKRSGQSASEFVVTLSGSERLNITATDTIVKNNLKTNNILEYTSDTGININSLKHKADTIGLGANPYLNFKTSGLVFNENLQNLDFTLKDISGDAFFLDSSAQRLYSKKLHTFENNILVNTISEFTGANGVSIDGVLLKDSTVLTGIINSNSGISLNMDIDGSGTGSSFSINDDYFKKFEITTAGIFVLNKRTGGQMISLVDSLASNFVEANPYLDFRFSTSDGGATTRLGWFGFGSTNDSDLGITNEVGNIDYSATKHIFYQEINADIIKERTANAGVTIENVLLRDGNVSGSFSGSLFSSGGGVALVDTSATSAIDATPFLDFRFSSSPGATTTRLGYLGFGSNLDNDMTIRNDVGILEYSATKHIFYQEVNADLIKERTVNAGVTIESVLIKDGTITGALVGNASTSSNASLLGGASLASVRTASLLTGTINDANLPTTISSNITGNASTATRLVTANGTISDFKEGTFTPNINCFTSSVVAEGRYQKVQNIVNLSIYFELNNSNRTGTGSTLIQISNVPYLSSVTTQKASLLNLSIESGFYAFENNLGGIHALVDANANVLNFIYYNEFERSPMTISQLATWTGVKRIRISGQLFLF